MGQPARAYSEPPVENEIEARSGQAPPSFNRTVKPHWRVNGFLASRAIDWLWPYTKRTLPNQDKAVNMSLRVSVTWVAIHHWLHGRRTFPSWAAEALRDRIRERAYAGLAIADELDQHIATVAHKPRHQRGLGRVKADE